MTQKISFIEHHLPVVRGHHTHIQLWLCHGVMYFFAWKFPTKKDEEKYLDDKTVAVFKIKWK